MASTDDEVPGGGRDALARAAASNEPGSGLARSAVSLAFSSGGSPSRDGAAPALVAGRYEILGLLGVGGMGSVYKARDAELDEIVALKAIRREIVDRPGMLERFRREVKLARRVTHANVARVFDIHEHDGEKFLTMEYVDGESLAAVLAREGRLSVARVVEIALAVCAGLSAAHAAGVVHRDLKPDNVLVATSGRAVITDFGVAREDDGVRSDATAVGVAVGTPAYMAPEQVEGSDVDARVDLYALGAMLFELLTGERPFQGESPFAVAAARLVAPPPDPRANGRDVPDACARLVMRCMARRREDRPASAAAVASELASLTLPAVGAAATPTVAVRAVAPAPTVSSSAGAAPASPKGEKTVAVLPFRNAGAPADDYLAEAITEDLIDALSMTKGLRVRPRGVVMRYKGTDHDPRDLGRELGVQVVVEGSVRRAPGAVRVSARLVGVDDGFQIWAKRFDRPENDLLAVNDEAARAIASALTADLAGPARAPLTDPIAVDLYLRARHEYHQFWQPNLVRAVGLFEQALERAPNDPSLLSGYALAWMRRSFFVGEGADKARAAAERAVEVAPELGESRLALASVKFQGGDAVGAVRDLSIALGRAPALAEAHFFLGRILTEAGRSDEGIRRLAWSIQLEPANGLAYRELARARALRGEWHLVDDAAEPTGAPGDRISRYVARARFAMWRRDVEAGRALLASLSSEERGSTFLPQALVEVLVDGAYPFARPEMAALMRDIGASPRRLVFFSQMDAEVSAFLGRADAALAALERASAAGLIDLLWLDRCPLFDELRSHPRLLAARAPVADRAAAILRAFDAG
jgi:serine/threonine-protein kinase